MRHHTSNIDIPLYKAARGAATQISTISEGVEKDVSKIILNPEDRIMLVNANIYDQKNVPVSFTVANIKGNFIVTQSPMVDFHTRWLEIIEDGITSKFCEPGIKEVEKVGLERNLDNSIFYSNPINTEKLSDIGKKFSINTIITYRVTGLSDPKLFSTIPNSSLQIRLFVKIVDVESGIIKWAGIIEEKFVP